MTPIPEIPITHSILRADALAEAIGVDYDLGGPVYAELMSRGVNDVYLVRAGQRRFAARVLRHKFRTEDQVRYEMALIRFHANHGLDAAVPVATRGGDDFITVLAPEGPRHLSLFTWAAGAPMARHGTPNEAHRLGGIVARMHGVAEGFQPPAPVDVDTPAFMARNRVALMTMVGAGSVEGKLYAALMDRASAKLEGLVVPYGACHGDIHTHNVFLADDGRLTFLDWDNCGADFFAKELMHFVWRNDYLGVAPNINAAFLEGYNAVRPLSADERALLPFFLTVRHLFILCGMAGMINVVGRSAVGYSHQLSRFHDLIQQPAREAGLL
ncbi:MAG: phosphotransferase [Alphaproteobacteria bacterium]|nr:phosphotransferase [Alphaproteobacteria bacterium]